MKATALDPAALTPGARRILETAAQLFYDHGITAVGVDLIAERSGVTKRTLYNRFGSKDTLVATYLRERDQRWRAVVMAAVATEGLDAHERLLAPFDALRNWTASNPRGCAFLNALAEIPAADHPARQIATAEKQWLLGLFERLTTEADLAEPATLARQLLLLHEGALATHAALPDLGAPDLAEQAARDLLRAWPH